MKKTVIFLIVLAFVLAALVSCKSASGNSDESISDLTDDTKASDTTVADDTNAAQTQIPNPKKDSSLSEVEKLDGLSISGTFGNWSVKDVYRYDTEGSPIVEVSIYSEDEETGYFRALKFDSYFDISGLYGEWEPYDEFDSAANPAISEVKHTEIDGTRYGLVGWNRDGHTFVAVMDLNPSYDALIALYESLDGAITVK